MSVAVSAENLRVEDLGVHPASDERGSDEGKDEAPYAVRATKL
jgi:hypothetical protein